ncbi:NDP-sugar synthase [bacterium]|nr:NDP-sugar synthase [bacterium]
MKALILAAGFGTRLAPITDTLPKPLVPIINIPVIRYNIALLKSVGIKDIYINVHHGAEKIMDTLQDGQKFGVSITYLQEKEILGTGGAIGALKGLVDDTILVINADTIMDVDIESMIDQHQISKRVVTLGLLNASKHDARSVVACNRDGQIVRMIDAYTTENLPEGNAIFSGVHLIEPALLEYIPPNIYRSITTHIYTRIMQEGIEIGGYFFTGDWWDIGTPEAYLTCHYELIDRGFLSFFNPVQPDGDERVIDKSQLVIFDDKMKLPIVPLHPPLIVGESVKVKDVDSLGPYLVVGKGVTIPKESETARAVYLAQANGTKFLTAPNGIIYY